MSETFYFYDLETSGFHPRNHRIMQFAGQRTTLELEPIGEPDDFLIQLTNDILPDPDAILMTGITPQRTKSEGYSEKDFLLEFLDTIAIPGTIFVGYNSIRFDDEFMRALLYRNLYDPYEWQWKEGRSKWDLLDVIRMTRALRPDGIQWPLSDTGAKINTLETIARANNLEHTHAHNAMSDVIASIEVARLIRNQQPKLFSYLLEMRDKSKIKNLVSSPLPFVYTSGSFEGQFEKTTIAVTLDNTDPSGALVYDLRYNPEVWIKEYSVGNEYRHHPIKKIKYNHCPAIAPLGVMDDISWRNIGLDQSTIDTHLEFALKHKDKLLATYKPKEQASATKHSTPVPIEDVDGLLYDGFIGAHDKKLITRLHEMSLDELIDFRPEFDDPRLPGLLFLYKARQVPGSLLAEDREAYEEYVTHKLLGTGGDSQFERFMAKLNELAKLDYLDADKRYILEELALYAQSIVPLDV